MGQVISHKIDPVQSMSLENKLNLAISYSSHILDDTPDTLIIPIEYINYLNEEAILYKDKLYSIHSSDILNIYRDQIYEILTSEEFKNLKPHLFKKIIFASQNCKKIVVIDILSNSHIKTDMVINMEGFIKSFT
jgi:hypothetical protein